MAFRVGQKVVCIKTWKLSGLGRGDEIGPVKGRVYTIREIGMGLNMAYPEELQFRLVEIVNPQLNYGVGVYEIAFRSARFRPIVERPTDISIFTAMLNPSKQTVDAQ